MDGRAPEYSPHAGRHGTAVSLSAFADSLSPLHGVHHMRLSDRPRLRGLTVDVDRGRADRGEPETRHRRRSASLSSLHTRLTECDGTRQDPP